jgi:signal transduction histidine kinase
VNSQPDPRQTDSTHAEPAHTEPAGTEPAGTEPAGTEPAGTVTFRRRVLNSLPSWFSSLKGRLSLAIVSGVAAGVVIVTAGRGVQAGWLISSVAGAITALFVIQFLARGTTSPLRDLVHAARQMELGDYSVRVGSSSVTEIAQLEHAFNDMGAQLGEVDRFRRDLVANASHELRTPISVLRASLENMVDGVEEPTSDRLHLLLGQTVRLGRLTDQLLDLSLLESGQAPFDAHPVLIRPLLEHTAAALRTRADGRSVDITVEITGQPCVDGEVHRLEQVIVNLTENAIRHAPQGSMVMLRAKTVPDGVRIEVEDSGPGIPPDQAARVFERFHRVDAARRSADGGAGLGLSIARWIVELHHGRIWTEPASADLVMPGCRMVVELPTN